jgi:arylsulfatase A-like enzyme
MRVGLLALCLLLFACDRPPILDRPDAWVRFDLVAEPPRVAVNARGGAPWRVQTAFLGAAEVRDMSRVAVEQLAVFPRRTAGQVRALEQAAGSRLAWTVALGRAPHVAFVPLGVGERNCPCRYAVGVKDSRGAFHVLHRAAAEPAGPIAPATVEIDLGDFAETTVEILFQVDGPTDSPGPLPTLLWGSPAVYGRQALDSFHPDGATATRPNVILIGLDTLRADHVGVYREGLALPPSLTPEIDALAGEGDLWLAAHSTFSNTNPSFASILTGLYGKNHGVYDLKTPLPPAHTTLAERFQDAGYDTRAFISASHLGDHNSGLGQGFDEVTLASHHFAAELPVDGALDWIAGRGRPFFLWLHLFDPHTPHTPPDPYSVGFRPERPRGLAPVESWIPFRRPGSREFDEPVLGGQSELYQGEVAYLDHQVGRLVDFLRSRGLLETTLLAVVADHGENLGEHGMLYRHVGLWETTTHVPLLVRWPAKEPRGRRFPQLVQTLDLFPTLLAAAGLDVPLQDGVDLRQLTFDGRTGRRAVFAEHADRSDEMVRTATHRYVESRGNAAIPAGVYLYDLTTDPGEGHNLAGQGLPIEAELARILAGWRAERRGGPAAQSRVPTAEEEAKLKALGYLQ